LSVDGSENVAPMAGMRSD